MTQGRPANGNGPTTGPVHRGPASDPPGPDPSCPNGAGPIRCTVTVVNPLGLHHRVADLFAKTAKRFTAGVTVWNGDLRADGKSLWDLMGLLAFEGTAVVLEVDGPDASDAVGPLAAILAAPGGEDYKD